MLSALNDVIEQQGREKTYLIGYSGGLDSQVLLHLCYRLSKTIPLKLRAIHVHHGLSDHADSWSYHCRSMCERYAIPLVVERIELDRVNGESLEALAREKRYQVFKKFMHEQTVLLTAHHQDDQAETLLVQLSRGAGVQGLAAMSNLKPWMRGYHARPLLNFPRERLEAYAGAENLVWVEDESNQNHALTRNFFRHQVFPLLKARWPTITTTIARTAKHAAEASQLLDEFALILLDAVKGKEVDTLSIGKLLALSHAQQKLVLRAWIKHLGFLVPNTSKLEAVQQSVLKAARDRCPQIGWANVSIRRFKDDLYLVKNYPPRNNDRLTWDFRTPLNLTSLGKLSATKVRGSGFHINLTEIDVQFRLGGEQAYIQGRGRRRLKQLFQEWQVPTWKRDAVPLFFKNERLIGVLGYFMDKEYLAQGDEEGYELHWEFSES